MQKTLGKFPLSHLVSRVSLDGMPVPLRLAIVGKLPILNAINNPHLIQEKSR